MSLPYPFLESYLMFFIYSFVGWVIEVIYYGITEGKFINRGFLTIINFFTFYFAYSFPWIYRINVSHISRRKCNVFSVGRNCSI